MNIESMKESLYSGVWGTIGAKFEEASEKIAKKCGGSHGVLMHSKTAAYETVLRSLNLGYGDQVLCSVYSDRMDAEIAAAIGVTPVFADIEKDSYVISTGKAEEILSSNEKIKVLIVDYSENLKLSELKEICEKYSCRLVVNAGKALDSSFDFKGIYAVIFDIGICGAAVVGTETDYITIFAWHHCGHAPGTGSSISFDKIVGGDMRASEWQAIQAMELMKGLHSAEDIKKSDYIFAWENLALKTVYFRKMTGYNGEYTAEEYPNALNVVHNCR